jgi:LTXXQ motif family protein
MNSIPAALAIVVAASIAVSYPAAAQMGRDQHHQGGTAAPGAAMPQGSMGTHMGGSGMPGSGMPGPGAMGQGMMGRGMMGGGMMQMMAGTCPMMGSMANEAAGPTFTEGRIAFMKAELGITDAQKMAWDAYATALKKNLEGMHGMRQTMMAAMAATNPVERFDARLAAMEGRVAAMRELKPALTQLYAVLTDDQKKKADQILIGMGCMM